jgi:hypothetical protein
MATSEDTTQQPAEEWRAVVGFEGVYEVSSVGRVRRVLLYRHKSNALPPARGTTLNRRGYPIVALSSAGRRKLATVHSLVAEAFIGPRPEGMQINHIDGVKTNNAPSNLEYVSAAQNIRHAAAMGLMPTGERHGSRTKPERLARGDRSGARTKPERIARGDRSGPRLHPEKYRGENSGHAVLTEAQVLEIRARCGTGELSQSEAARRHGLTPGAVWRIVHRRNWRHI